MKTLELDDRQVEVLRNVLSNYLSDLSMEIADTDSKDFRDELKQRKQAVEQILDDLG